MNFRRKINHNLNFSEFSKTEAINLKKMNLIFSRCNPFPSWPSAAQDTYVYSQRTSKIILKKTGPFLVFH